jgi:hypothetical protein
MGTQPPSQSGESPQTTQSGQTSNPAGQSGQTGTSGSMGSSSSTSQSGTSSSGTMGATGTADQGNLRTVTGSVQKVDQNSITLDQGVTLTVDSQTQVLRRGQPVAAGISAIREGQQVRASFDPASNRAEKIEVMGTSRHHKAKSGSSGQSSMNQGSSSSGNIGSSTSGSSTDQGSSNTCSNSGQNPR